MDLINALPGISSVNMVQHTAIYEAMFSIGHPCQAVVGQRGYATCF
jgi:hypothetical protein